MQSTEENYVLKTANARELIGNLPAPQNLKRNIDLVPDIQINFLLSTTKELPKHIVAQIEASENKKEFTNKSLLGLCTSGRGMPVEIFLHEHVITARDPSGELFEEVVWHETVHGIEGIEINAEGEYKRQMPWSYKLQRIMLSIDRESEHKPNFPNDPREKAYIQYLRNGTSLQENVSEVFARLAAIFMYEIKETGVALTTTEALFELLSNQSISRRGTRKERNIFDFQRTWETFSKEAQQFFIKENDHLIRRIAKLYGCDLPLAKSF